MGQVRYETVELVWNDLLGADRLHRYYGYLAERLGKINAWLIVIASSCSGGAFVVFLSDLNPPWNNSVGALILITAGLNVWLATKNYSRMMSHSADMHRQLARLLRDWEELWADVYTSDDASVRARWRDLRQKTLAVTEKAASQVPRIESLVKKSQEEAYSYRSLRYAQT